MEEATEELYQEYLKDKLPLIFQEYNKEYHDKSNAYLYIYHFRNKNKGPEIIHYASYVETFYEYNFKDSFGNIINDYYYIQHDGFHDGYFLVKNYDGKYNYVSIDGKLLLSKWVDIGKDFSDKRAVVKADGKYYVIDTQGIQISNKFDMIHSYENGVALVETNPRFGKGYSNLIDLSGMEIFDRYLSTTYLYRLKSSYFREKINDSFDSITIGTEDLIIYKTVDLADYKVSIKHGKYECTNNIDTFRILYRPLRIYDNRFTLCIKDGVVFLYDRLINNYETLGTYKDISFKDKFIFDNKNKKVLFVYEEKVIDITNYYNNNLKGKDNYQIKAGIPFLSKNDFFIRREEKIKEQKRIDDMQKEQKRIEDSMTSEQKEMARLQKEKIRREQELQIYREEVLHEMTNLTKKIAYIEQLSGKVERVKFDHIYTTVNNHKEIRPDIILSGFLKIIDLSAETFENVKISGIDFSGHVLSSLNPQKVYNSDLSNCNFEGVYFPVSTNFTNVNICGTRFTNDGKSTTFDINEETLAKGIYDEKTTLNGIPLIELINKKRK